LNHSRHGILRYAQDDTLFAQDDTLNEANG